MEYDQVLEAGSFQMIPEIVSWHNDISSLLCSSGKYDLATEYAKHTIVEYELLPEKNELLYSVCLENLANCYAFTRDYVKAADLHKEVLEIYRDYYGESSREYAVELTNFSNDLLDLGEIQEAFDSSQRALLILEQMTEKAPDDYSTVLSSLAVCYQAMGNYPAALAYNMSAKEQYEGSDLGYDQEYARLLHNISICYGELGQIDKALEYADESMKVYEAELGKESVLYIDCLHNLANRFCDIGDYDMALDYLTQALSLEERFFGSNTQKYAMILLSIGNIFYLNQGYSTAIDQYREALSIIESFDSSHDSQRQIAMLYNNIALCESRLNNHQSALMYERQAFEINRSHFSNAPEMYLINTYLMSVFNLALVKVDETSYYAEEFVSTLGDVVRNAFSFMSQTNHDAYWSKYNVFMTDVLFDWTAYLDSPEIRRAAYDGALLGKGLLLNAETEMRKLILESGDEQALGMYNAIQESRIRLDKLYENPIGKKDQIDSLNNDIESRQQELMKCSKVFGDYTRNLALKWTDIQSALGKKDIAIEFETYTHQDTTFYIALTLKTGYTEPHLVELFNSKDLETIKPSRYYMTTSLPELVWGPLSEELAGVRNVYFSPAGELNNIGIEYLLDKDGKHLVSDKRTYYRLTSTRELVKDKKNGKMTYATVYGGIRYDISPASKLTGEEPESELLAMSATRSHTPLDSLSGTRGGWKYLPGTKAEADAISTTLTSRKVYNDLLEGEQGTEESFKSLSGARKDVIHIATHGFYWTETEAARSGMETSSFMLEGDSSAPKEDKALTRSGLLFAGAQNAFDGKEIPLDVEDGILTAKDISRMDLRGTDLVVISACQSGLGEVTGDGVFGLQRGFKKAGVQSIVMSLWEVDDDATRIMITRFYENLAKGKTKYDAFREAQKYLRRYDKGRYDEPEYYAAFVLLDAIK